MERKLKKYAVVTIAIGEKYSAIAKYTHPSLKAYADKIDAEFVVIDDTSTSLPHWKKFEIFNLLKDYKRIIYIDTDIIIREDTPNLFDLIPENKLGIFNEGRFTPRWESLKEACMSYKEDIDKKWDGAYYNTGVMVISRQQKELFKMPKEVHDAGMFEQPYLNLRIINDKVSVEELDYHYNRMTIMDDLTGEPRYASYIIHYAGAPNQYDMIRVMMEDMDRWENDKPDYKYKRKVIWQIGGGLGDQICAEPVIRYTMEKIYQDADMALISNWPNLFTHLNIPCLKDGEFKGIRDPIKVLKTMPDTKEAIWNVIPHTLCHTVDFVSMSTIHRVLPDIDKQIKLIPTFDGLTELMDIIGINGAENSIVVHPGRGWESKTFPKSWWDDVIQGLVDLGHKVFIVGKHISKEQGYVDVEVPEGAIDLRDQLTHESLVVLIAQAKITVSNDSAPIHIAGAFDNWIVLIPTCKHPDNVLPYRNGSKSYKTKSLYKKLTVDEIDSSPTQVHGQTLDWVNGDIIDYLPNTSLVIDEIDEIMKKV